MRHPVRIALYGDNGHQLPLYGDPAWRDLGRVVAFAGFRAVPDSSDATGDPEARDAAAARRTGPAPLTSLDAILARPEVDLVSLCSPRRVDQAEDAIRCMEAGKHVLAEKPCAMRESDLDRIIETSERTGRIFHEMAPTIVEEPYATMREIVRAGRVGEVIQVYAQKSYPWFDGRPADERVDGGLLRQVGVYLFRFVEHVAGVRVTAAEAHETTLANQGGSSECRRAASVVMRLANGGVASGVANYCTPAPPVWQPWGYETLRIFGEDGFVESINRGETLRLATAGEGVVDLRIPGEAPARRPGFTELVLRHVAGTAEPPVPMREELHPTRMVNRAKAHADRARHSAADWSAGASGGG